MLRIAYCQISAHPAYCGPSGNYCKEPVYSSQGTILNDISHISNVYSICNQIQEVYIAKFKFKIQQVLHKLKGKKIDILVFPEYTIPAECLPLIYDFCQEETCVCIAASHTVQQSNQEIYEYIKMDISLEDCINMSCCPVIFPNNVTKHFFKRYKSKWEANMDNEEYMSKNDIFTFDFNEQKITVLLCIDALHIDVDQKQTDILIVSAATPSDGSFKNKFESHLTKEIPTIFCNFYLYGNSTVYCSVPKNTNLPYAEKTHLTKTSAYEEAVIITEIYETAQAIKTHTINTTVPVQISEILPILYRDDNSEQKVWGLLSNYSQKKEYDKLKSVIDSFRSLEDGIVAKKKIYLSTGIRERTLSFSQIESLSDFIYINDFLLKQYEANWLDKTMKCLMDSVSSGQIPITDIHYALLQLGTEYSQLLPSINEKIDLPVFEEKIKSNSVFQNRGGEIQTFRDVYQNMYATIFVVQGFPQIGKSAFVDRLRSLYSFSTIDCPIPRGGGFESLIRWVCQVCKIPIEWQSLDEKEIKEFACDFAHYLNNLNKTIVILRTTGNLLDSYNQPKTILFLCSLAEKLFELHSGIKLIIENSRLLPIAISNHPNISVCKLRPLLDMYIERLIEQTANNLTYSLSLPQIPKSSIRQCRGNPALARMVGVCVGNRLNNGLDSKVPQEDLEAFADKYTDGILDALNISDEEREFLTEATIYRLQVSAEAFRNFPHYSDQAFRVLQDKLLIENFDGWFSVTSLIASSLRKKVAGSITLHEIAAKYFDDEYKSKKYYVSKAEFFYHSSFCTEKMRTKGDLRYYANDILSAAIELINSGEIAIAKSHLSSIRFYPESYDFSEFLFYYAFCHIMNDEYSEYRHLFDDAIKYSTGNKDVLYYRMIDRLIRARYLTEAEALLNEVCERYSQTRQMDALWVAYYYASKQTRDKALDMAINLTKTSAGEFHSAKILVRIYLRENMPNEALQEVDAVLANWGNNHWAQKMHYLISTEKYKASETDENFDEDDGQEV